MNENPESSNRVPVAGLAVDACSARCPTAKNTTEVIGQLRAYIDYACVWKEARVQVLVDAVAKIEEMRRALDEVEELERELSVESYGFGEIVRKVT